MEEWRDIPDIEFYQASSHGRIRSLDRTLHFNNGYVDQSQFYKGQILKHYYNRKGYHRVDLGRHGGKWFVHSLIAITFRGPQPFPKWQVDHIDNDKNNNYVTNIQWLPSWCNNVKNRDENGNRKGAKPITLRNTLTNELHIFDSGIDASVLGLSSANITRIRKGKISKGYIMV